MDTSKITDWSKLRAELEVREGVMSVDMHVLRRLNDSRRMGTVIGEQISKKLQSLGIGHFGPELPRYSDDMVRLFILGSSAAELMGAIQNPGEQQDEVIRRAVASDSQEVLIKIRGLVCDLP